MTPPNKERRNRWGKREVTFRRLQSPSYKANETKQTKEKRKQATVETTSSTNKDGLATDCSEWSLFISTSLPRRGSREAQHILMVLSTFELFCIQLQSILPEVITVALCHRHLKAHPLYMNSDVLLLDNYPCSGKSMLIFSRTLQGPSVITTSHLRNT